MFGIIVIQEGVVTTSHQAHEEPTGHPAHIGQGQPTGGTRAHKGILDLMKDHQTRLQSEVLSLDRIWIWVED